MQSFHDLPLSAALLKALDALGFSRPTPVQAASLPPLLRGEDVIAQAQTGSGKTAAFGLALLQRLQTDATGVQALVLCPTRELADQVSGELRALARFMPNIKILSLCGGISIRPQLASLAHPPQIAVGTPGRLQDLLRREALDLDGLHTVVLDEADRMLDMGFVDAVRAILRRTPDQRLTALFSATYPEAVRDLSRTFQRQPQTITVAESVDSQPDIVQCLHAVALRDKPAALLQLLQHHNPDRALVFCNTRQDVRMVSEQLADHELRALALHGEMEQRDRDETLVQFANGSCRVLVATDVAARGLDIDALPLVIAYELPAEPEVHVHRIGRTGRAGASGQAVALYTDREAPRIERIEALTGSRLPRAALPTAGKARLQAPLWQTLVIDGGRKDKLRPGDLLGALTGIGELQADEVGRIDIFPTRSYVAVSRRSARPVQQRLSAGRIKGRRFRVRCL